MTIAITLEQIINFLLEAPMFGDLNPTELSEVVHIMQVQRLREGQFVFREGDVGDAWYVLYSGSVEVLKDVGVGTQVVATLHERACFGEMAILDGSTRSATVRALTEATAFRFPRAGFLELLENGNLSAYKLVHQMALVLVARQRESTSRLAGLLHSEEDEVHMREGITPIVEKQSMTE